MRRSKSAAVYQATHNVRACQHLLGHKSIASTASTLAVDQREALDLAKKPVLLLAYVQPEQLEKLTFSDSKNSFSATRYNFP